MMWISKKKLEAMIEESESRMRHELKVGLGLLHVEVLGQVSQI